MSDERFRSLLLVIFSIAIFYVYYRNMRPKRYVTGIIHDTSFPACPVCGGGCIKEQPKE